MASQATPSLVEDTWSKEEVNTSFSKLMPNLQLAIDSTSLGAFKQCEELYRLTIIEGWVPQEESFHLTFGLLLHGARERYDHARAKGASHDDALDTTLEWYLASTWDKALGKPWNSGDPNKNRLTGLRSIIWYLDQFGAQDNLQTVILSSGKPAVELSFTIDLGITAVTGEPFILCGHGDRIAALGTDTYWLDLKSTKHGLGARYYSQFSPNNQMSLYALAGTTVFRQPIKGILVDAVQVLVGDTRIERQPVHRTPDQLEEWLVDTRGWVRQMEEAASSGHWKHNDQACGLYGGCKFREVCARSPGTREQWLHQKYRKRVWDPLQRRGDI